MLWFPVPLRLPLGLKPGLRSLFLEPELKWEKFERDRLLLPERRPGLLVLFPGRDEKELLEDPRWLLLDEEFGVPGRMVDLVIRLEDDLPDRDALAERDGLIECEGALLRDEELPRENELPLDDLAPEYPLDRPLLRDILPDDLPL